MTDLSSKLLLNNQAYHGGLELLIFCEAVSFFIRNMSAHFDCANGKNGFPCFNSWLDLPKTFPKFRNNFPYITGTFVIKFLQHEIASTQNSDFYDTK